MNRRSFLSTVTTATGSILVSTSPIAFATESVDMQAIDAKKFVSDNFTPQSLSTISPGLTRRQWKTIIAVQDHLFPSDITNNNTKSKAPSAKDVNSKAYLYAVLADPGRDNEDRILVKDGLIDLQDICWKKYKKTFIDCNHKQREDSLRTLEKMPIGRPWLMTILGYIFEALLVDPVYGGNPNGIGWKWLEHNPGLPRPTVNTRYFLL
jgi:gluconate 2-dehydrogenase gamma chain